MTDEPRIALVTGGSRGIGGAIARALARRGADVGIVFVGDHAESAAVRADVEAAGRRFWQRVTDVSDRSAVAEAVEALTAAFGRIDWLVNNAGIIRDRVSWKMSDAEWDEVIATNLTGCFNVTRAVIPQMRARRYGRIVNITSINGLRGKFGQANYSAAKAGLVGLTKTLAKELATFGITVNAVAPGMVRTEMYESIPAEARDRSNAECPMGRPAEADEVAELVAFLCGDAAGYITGEVIKIDGGQYI